MTETKILEENFEEFVHEMRDEKAATKTLMIGTEPIYLKVIPIPRVPLAKPVSKNKLETEFKNTLTEWLPNVSPRFIQKCWEDFKIKIEL